MINRIGKQFKKELIAVMFILMMSGHSLIAQDTVSDYDGNVYNTVTIGTQVWMKENLKSRHYSDGTLIPDVVAYNDNDSLGNIYGLLYTWNAAMKNTTTAGAQGVCPCEWHVPTHSEWTTLENFLGGASVAGNKMKDTTPGHWDSSAYYPGATNSSGLSVLPGGEYDDYYTPHQFRLLHEYAVFWTSTQVTTTKARERFIAYNSALSGIYDWYKVMKYSIRCIKDTTSVNVPDENKKIKSFNLFQNYPNPFNPSTTISFELQTRGHVELKIYNTLGQEIVTLINRELPAGQHQVNWKAEDLSSGIYFYKLFAGSHHSVKKMVLAK